MVFHMIWFIRPGHLSRLLPDKTEINPFFVKIQAIKVINSDPGFDVIV